MDAAQPRDGGHRGVDLVLQGRRPQSSAGRHGASPGCLGRRHGHMTRPAGADRPVALAVDRRDPMDEPRPAEESLDDRPRFGDPRRHRRVAGPRAARRDLPSPLDRRHRGDREGRVGRADDPVEPPVVPVRRHGVPGQPDPARDPGRQGVPQPRRDRRAGRPRGDRDPGEVRARPRRRVRPGGDPGRDHHQRRVQGGGRRGRGARAPGPRGGAPVGHPRRGAELPRRDEPGRPDERDVRGGHREPGPGGLRLPVGRAADRDPGLGRARERGLQRDREPGVDAGRGLGRRHRLPGQRPQHRLDRDLHGDHRRRAVVPVRGARGRAVQADHRDQAGPHRPGGEGGRVAHGLADRLGRRARCRLPAGGRAAGRLDQRAVRGVRDPGQAAAAARSAAVDRDQRGRPGRHRDRRADRRRRRAGRDQRRPRWRRSTRSCRRSGATTTRSTSSATPRPTGTRRRSRWPPRTPRPTACW